MIDRIIEFSIRNRGAVILAALALAAWGAFAAFDTPIDAIPDLSENQVIVFTDWMGHSPREVEDQVTYPLSVRLQGLKGVKVVRSSSDFNFSMINLIFEDSTDVAEARRLVAGRLEGLEGLLPTGVAPHLGPDALATGQIFWYTVEGPGYDLGRLRAVQDWYVRPQIASVPGVAEVASVGGYPTEYQINVDPSRLREKGVTLGEVVNAVGAANSAVGGHVVQKSNAEYLVRGAGWLGASGPDGTDFDPTQAVRDIERAVIPRASGGSVRVADVAAVTVGPGFRRGVLEKDGNEVTGGVVLMSRGENPLEVTRRLHAKIHELQVGLPAGVKVVPFYDRTPLIEGAVGTVTGTLVEAMITATVCVLVILLHVRTSFIIALTLPLSALASFAAMWALRRLGVADIQTNVMSLAGIVISIGVLVDSSIVMAENAMHALRERFGDRPVRGDVRAIVLPACRTVGRPIFFSVLIMLLSFLPVFALGGIEGKMFRPLAFTKSFALLAVAGLSITLVPALCTVFIRGRLRDETASPIVRGVIEVYRPVLGYLIDRPSVLAWLMGVTFVVGLSPVGSRAVFLTTLFLAVVACGMTARGWRSRALSVASLVLVALVADQNVTPLGREFMTPLDEGMLMDMPITVPRASVTQSADDLKARDMILCRFPEVDMVVGKAGRAETPTDPAPMDMIETMVNFRPREFWPRRRLRDEDAVRLGGDVFDALAAAGLLRPPADPAARAALVHESVTAAVPVFDAVLREHAYQRILEIDRGLGINNSGHVAPDRRQRSARAGQVRALDGELIQRAAAAFPRLVSEEILARSDTTDPAVTALARERRRLRSEPAAGRALVGHHGTRALPPKAFEPHPILDGLYEDLTRRFTSRLMLWRKEPAELTAELDQSVQMPGWTNIWTMPIQNRVDMLATGVNTAVGVRVLGRRLDDVVKASEAIAEAVKGVPGAVDVVADPVRGKGYLEVVPDRDKAARLGVRVADINEAVETALAGKTATTVVAGRERHPARVRYARDFRTDEESVKNVLVPASGGEGSGPAAAPRQVRLGQVADVKITEGPATIKSENGFLRNYVRFNARGRSAGEVADDARRAVAAKVRLPADVTTEWTGQYEHERSARRTLAVVLPVVVVLILGVLYWTYRDWADAGLMLLAVPGAIAGGVFFQWLLGFTFSVTVWVGYIACFGMATSTGIIMLVYLREAVDKAGGLETVSLDGLRQAVMDGAVHRLRPKLLTEGTTIIGLAPMLWASGVGSEVIRPMAAPVLGGLLVADEVIDLLLPVLFYWVRRRRWRALRPSPSRAGRPSLDAVGRLAS